MNEAGQLLPVEVGYIAADGRTFLQQLQVEAGSTADSVLSLSALATEFPEADTASAVIGICGIVCSRDTTVQAWDRIEVYRLITADPKEIRRRKAQVSSATQRNTAIQKYPGGKGGKEHG